jgi:hypothetical protein
VVKTVKTLLEKATPVVPEDFQNHQAPVLLDVSQLRFPPLKAWILDDSAAGGEKQQTFVGSTKSGAEGGFMLGMMNVAIKRN